MDIKIYGTLKNDTNEPIAYASQIYDAAGGKSILQIIDDKIQAIDIPEYELPEATGEILGGIRLGKYLREDREKKGTIMVQEALDSSPGVISETRVGVLSKSELLKSLEEFTSGPKDEEHPYFPDYIKLVQFGTWAMSEGAFETFSAKMKEPALKDYANIKEGTITIGEESITPITELPDLSDFQTKEDAKEEHQAIADSIGSLARNVGINFASKSSVDDLTKRVTKLEGEEYMTEQEAVDMVKKIFG